MAIKILTFEGFAFMYVTFFFFSLHVWTPLCLRQACKPDVNRTKPVSLITLFFFLKLIGQGNKIHAVIGYNCTSFLTQLWSSNPTGQSQLNERFRKEIRKCVEFILNNKSV